VSPVPAVLVDPEVPVDPEDPPAPVVSAGTPGHASRASGAAGRLPLGSVLAGAVVATLVRPMSWALALAGFLAGGGLVLVAWPILVVPTPTGLQNALGGPITTLVFGVTTPELVALIGAVVVGAVLLVVAAVFTGAWAERAGILVTLEAAAEEEIADPPALDGAPGAWRVAALRLLGLVPVVVALVLAWKPIYDTTYHELILPDDLATPLPIRVIRALPLLLAGLGLVWLLADAAATVGVRHLVLERRSVGSAWLAGWADLARRPLRILVTAIAGLALVLALLGPSLVAAAVGWSRVRDILAGGRDPVVAVVAVVIWVSIWLGSLVLAGVGAGIRAAAWTLELPRRPADPGPSPD